MGQMIEVTLEIDADVKEQAEAVFAEYELTKEVIRLGRLPFELDDDLLEYAQMHSIHIHGGKQE